MAGNISSLSLTGSSRVTSIVNGSLAVVAAITSTPAFSSGACSLTLSGATVANTLKTAYSASGRGRVNYLAAYCVDATSRTIRFKVTLDNVVVYDKTSSAISAANSGVAPLGVTSTNCVVFQPIEYNQSCLIEFASSVSETDKITIGLNAEVRV